MHSIESDSSTANGGMGKRITDGVRSISAAVSGAAAAVSGGFRALAGLTTGGLARADRQFTALYKEAEQIVRRHVPWLRSYEADEVVSNIAHAELKREPGDPKSWFVLSAAARRQYLIKAVTTSKIDHNRRWKRNRAFLDESGQGLAAPTDPVHTDEFDDSVADGLRHLGKGRDLYVDVRFNGLNHEQAAAKHGVTMSQVKARMTSGNKLMVEVCHAYQEDRKPVFPKAGRPAKNRKGTKGIKGGDQ